MSSLREAVIQTIYDEIYDASYLGAEIVGHQEAADAAIAAVLTHLIAEAERNAFWVCAIQQVGANVTLAHWLRSHMKEDPT